MNKYKNQKSKKIAIISGLVVSTIAYAAFMPYNFFAKSLFNFKYKEETTSTIEALKEIKNVNQFSKNDYINHYEFILFSFQNHFDDNDEIWNINKMEDFDKIENYEKFVVPNQDKIKKHLEILDRKTLKYINKRDVNEMMPSFRSFSVMFNVQYMDMLNKLKENPAEGIAHFNRVHEGKMGMLKNTNYLLYNFFLIDSLNDDIEFAEYVKNNYDIKLNIKPLTKEHYDFKEAFANEKQMAFNLNPDITINAHERFYMNDIHAKTYKEIQEFFALSIENEKYKEHYLYNSLSDGYKNDWGLSKFKTNENIGYVEKKGAPVSTVLLNVSLPNYSSYKDEYRLYFTKQQSYIHK